MAGAQFEAGVWYNGRQSQRKSPNSRRDMNDSIPRCRVVPLPASQASFQISGIECLRWHFGHHYPRPFFYPLVGPAGAPLTRMGHPGASNHDHHRSIWFAHHKVLGIDFWSDKTEARIKQERWIAYQDGQDEAAMAVLLGWYDGHDPAALLEQELIAAVRQTPDGETMLELQSTFRPAANTLEFGKTNFGFLAVRVAASISEYFGGGRLTDAHRRTGEKAIFGNRARWMDYSGPTEPELPRPDGRDARDPTENGITYFDHPDNPGFPTHWHVREDGWMGASACMHGPRQITKENPLMVRYLLHAHAGSVDGASADTIANDFAAKPGFEIVRADRRHVEAAIRRAGVGES